MKKTDHPYDPASTVILSYEEALRVASAIAEAQHALNTPGDMRSLLHAYTALCEAADMLEIASGLVQTH